MKLHPELLRGLFDCAEGLYVVREDDKRLLFADGLPGGEPYGALEGQHCYAALFGRDAPCACCPQLEQDGTVYFWEYFDPVHRQWLRIKNRLITVDGDIYRLGNLNRIGELMNLGADAVREVGYMQRLIRERDEARDRLAYETGHDRLTGLWNRNQYSIDLEERYSDAQSMGVLYFDLNNLKEVNDCLGHCAGDKLLCCLAGAIQSARCRFDRAYRIGGDEFVVLCKNCAEVELSDCLTQIVEELDRRNRDGELPCVTAVGSAWSDKAIDLEELVREADRRMYDDKEKKKREKGKIETMIRIKDGAS